MANPTSLVPTSVQEYEDTKFYWPLIGGATFAKTYQCGEMLGKRADGYAQSFDDSAKLIFLGLQADTVPHQIDPTDADGAKRALIDRPYRFNVPLSSGTISRATDIGKTAYAVFSGTCSLSSGTFANAIGTIVDVGGVLQPDALTGNIAVIEPFKGNLIGQGTITASTAAAGTTTADAGALPAAGFSDAFLPTTAADDTKGVRIAAADAVTGRRLYIGNGVSNKILKVYGPSGAVINGAAADAAFSSVSGKGVVIICTSGSGNTWSAF